MPEEEHGLDSGKSGRGPAEVDQQFAVTYDALRALAHGAMRDERRRITLQPTALIHEVYLRLASVQHVEFENERAFKAVAARALRQVLVDHARARQAQKRGGGREAIALDATVDLEAVPELDVLDLEEALQALARLSPRRAEVVTLRFFGGLTTRGVAAVLGVTERTVKSDWRFARAFLQRALSLGGPS